MPISKFSTLTEMKDYVRKNKLNKGEIKLSMKKSVMLAALDKGGHIHTGARGADAPKKTPVKKATPKKTTKSSKKEEWEKLKKMSIFKEYMKRYMGNYDGSYQEKLDFVENNIFNKGLSSVKKFIEYIPQAMPKDL